MFTCKLPFDCNIVYVHIQIVTVHRNKEGRNYFRQVYFVTEINLVTCFNVAVILPSTGKSKWKLPLLGSV